MVAWMVVAEVAVAAAKAVQGYRQALKDAAERRARQQKLLTAIEITRTSILTAVNEQTIAQLKGELEGYETRYSEYDGNPTSQVDEQRLVDIIDQSATTCGWLGANIDNVPSRPGRLGDPAAENIAVELALESSAVLIPLIYLRVQAMTEHQITYKVPEVRDIPPFLGRHIPRLETLQTHIRRQSDARFESVRPHRHADYEERVYGYRFEGAG